MNKQPYLLSMLICISTICFCQDPDMTGIESTGSPLINKIIMPIEEESLSGWLITGAQIKLKAATVTEELNRYREIMYSHELQVLTQENRTYMTFQLPVDPGKKTGILLRLKDPVPVMGITQTISFWFYSSENDIAGINIILRDINDIEYKIPVCGRCPPSWQLHNISIPYKIPQSDPYRPNKAGITFHGFEVFAHPWKEPIDIGIDMVTAYIDVYNLYPAGPDAVVDGW